MKYGAPLLFYPLLTRTLGPTQFAVFALTLATAQVLTQLVEYGFGLMGVRELSAQREQSGACARIAGVIVAGRLVTAGLTAIGCGAFFILSQNLGAFPLDTAPQVVALATGYAFSASWYFIGTERAATLAKFEVATSFLQLLLMLTFVHAAGDVGLSLWLFSIPPWLFAIVGHVIALRDLGVRWPQPKEMWAGLRVSTRFFLVTGAPQIGNSLVVILLGASASPIQVAYYAAGDRLLSAAMNATLPIFRVIMPRITALVANRDEAASLLFARTAGLVIGAFCVGGIGASLLSPVLVPLVFGQRMAGGVPTFAILMMILPFSGLSRATGYLGLLPLRRERIYQCFALLSTLTLVGVAAPVASRYGANGLATARLSIECVASALAAITLFRLEPSWFSLRALSTKRRRAA